MSSLQPRKWQPIKYLSVSKGANSWWFWNSIISWALLLKSARDCVRSYCFLKLPYEEIACCMPRIDTNCNVREQQLAIWAIIKQILPKPSSPASAHNVRVLLNFSSPSGQCHSTAMFQGKPSGSFHLFKCHGDLVGILFQKWPQQN